MLCNSSLCHTHTPCHEELRQPGKRCNSHPQSHSYFFGANAELEVPGCGEGDAEKSRRRFGEINDDIQDRGGDGDAVGTRSSVPDSDISQDPLDPRRLLRWSFGRGDTGEESRPNLSAEPLLGGDEFISTNPSEKMQNPSQRRGFAGGFAIGST